MWGFGYCVICFILFFFSSRRRHTRLQGDWSSGRVLFQSMPTSRTCPAIRLSMGINGVTPAALPQIGQNFAGWESLAPQRSQNILMPRRHLVYPAWRNDRCLSSAHHARTRQATKNDGRPTGNLLYLGYGGGQGFVPEMLTCSP